MKISSKLPNTGITIFTTMSKLAADHGAINLSQGYPDFDAHPDLIERVQHHMRSGRNQYAPMQGVPILRERISKKILDTYGAHYDPETEITITSGATEALYAAITAVVQSGDEVIIFEPAYDAYDPIIRLNRGVPVYVELKHPTYHVDWDEVEGKLTEKTRLIIINTPHNPTGSVLSLEDIEALSRIAEQSNLLILSDEVYEHIVFDDVIHTSMSRYHELARRSFVVSSFGKTYHTTGWKLGYCLAPLPLSTEFQKIHQFLTFASNTPIQYAYADFLEDSAPYLELSEFYQRKRDRFLSLLEPSRFKAIPARGTYFQMLDYSDITRENDTDFSRRLTTEMGVASIPPSVFYHRHSDHKVLRFCFAKNDDTLEAAAEILCKI